MRHESRTSRRPLVLALFGLLAVAGLALGGATPVRRAIAQPRQSGDAAGYLIVAGTYIPPPYTVSATGEQVLIDGALFEDFSFQPAPLTQQPIDETDPTLSADDLGELARRYIVANYPPGSGELATETAAQYLRGLPAAPIVDDSTLGVLSIADQQGGQVNVLLEDPSWLSPPLEDASGAAQAAASDLQAQLDENVVFMGEDGALTTMPRAQGVAALQRAAQLIQQGLSADAIAQQLAPLLPSAELASELGQSFAPDDALLARLANEPAADSASSGGAPASAPSARYLDFDPTHHPLADTPGSENATVFSTTGDITGNAWTTVAATLEAHHYSVTVANAGQNTRFLARPRGTPIGTSDPGGLLNIVRSDTHDFTGSASPADFLAPAGVLYMETHGFPGWLTLQRYGTAAQAAQAAQRALTPTPFVDPATGASSALPPLAQPDEIKVGQANGFYFLAFSKAWIAKHWLDDDTVIFMNVCYSDSLYDGFGAADHSPYIVAPVDGPGPREYVGYDQPVIEEQLVPDANAPGGLRLDRYGPRDEVQFAKEMAGQLDQGNNRAARLAFATLKQDAPVPTGPNGLPLSFPLPDPDHPGQNKLVQAQAAKSILHRRPNIQYDTVLSPAVDNVSPTLTPVQAFQVGSTTYSGFVDYDTWLTTKPDPKAEIKLSGCLTLLSAQWIVQQGFTMRLQFTFQATVAGTANLTATNANALSRNNMRELSGNTPPGDHQDRNRKDFVWNAGCVNPVISGNTTPAPNTPTSTPASSKPKQVGLLPTSGPPGTAVALSADGFTPGQVGTVTFGQANVATTTVQPDGSATAIFDVPRDEPPGGYVVNFTTPQDGGATASFLVTTGSNGSSSDSGGQVCQISGGVLSCPGATPGRGGGTTPIGPSAP